ncbi:hypothetical protein MRX96_052262 [Rhipicephalus microplus]
MPTHKNAPERTTRRPQALHELPLASVTFTAQFFHRHDKQTDSMMAETRSGRESPASSDSSSEPPEGYVIVLTGFPGSFLRMREVAFADPIEPDNICVFCFTVPGFARPLPCQHIVCDQCSRTRVFVDEEQCLGYESDETSTHPHAECPIDATPIDRTFLDVQPFSMDRVQEELVFCFQANLGCEFVGKLKFLKYHYYCHCRFGPKTCDRCGNDGIPANQLLRHTRLCRPRRHWVFRRVHQ